nr:Type 1 glutamine amidotransferase-like domain-containing protein [Microlunatus panaciterrae]
MLRRDPRILYWPFALSGRMLEGAEAWLRDQLARRSSGADLVTWPSLESHSVDELTTFDLLFVGGGNTFGLLDHLDRHDFVEAVRRFVEDGGSYYGGSAGAILACDSIAIAEMHDTNDVGLTRLDGLGLLPGPALLPHYGPQHETAAQAWCRSHGGRVLGVPERSGIVVTDKDVRVVGREEVWILDGLQAQSCQPGDRLSL